MEFEWDEDKAAANSAKHRISFGAAIAIFDDPDELTERSPRPFAEERYQTIGETQAGAVLFVVFTYRGSPAQKKVRLISARKASRKERQRYEQQGR